MEARVASRVQLEHHASQGVGLKKTNALLRLPLQITAGEERMLKYCSPIKRPLVSSAGGSKKDLSDEWLRPVFEHTNRGWLVSVHGSAETIVAELRTATCGAGLSNLGNSSGS